MELMVVGQIREPNSFVASIPCRSRDALEFTGFIVLCNRLTGLRWWREYSQRPKSNNATLRIPPTKLRRYLGEEAHAWQSSSERNWMHDPPKSVCPVQSGIAPGRAFCQHYRRLMAGVLAQLVERLVRNEKVRGSNPLGSTIKSLGI
jgi:hypothetical protein